MMESIEEGFADAGAGDFRAMVEAVTPLGRYGQPDEIANMMVFLGSDDSSYCTGGVLYGRRWQFHLKLLINSF